MFSDIFEERKERELEIGSNGMSIDLLRAVYRNPSIPLPVRIRCAVAALPHEVPRLQVTAQVNEHSFAELLEARIKKWDAMNGQQIERTQVIDQSQIEAKPVLPRVADRRFRRM
jgi:hypothetical protein